jgi:hypothetical protein
MRHSGLPGFTTQSNTSEAPMAQKRSYDQELRSIGQFLEAERISVFELSNQMHAYVVTGEPEKETTLVAALKNWQKRIRRSAIEYPLSFTSSDIAELESQGKANRMKSDRLPDFHSLPNVLRMVGSYLKAKEADLIELRKRELSVSILSRSKSGHPEFEEKSLGSFYNLFIELHAKRAKAVKSGSSRQV